MPGYGLGYSALVRNSVSSAAPPSPYGALTTAWIAATGETDLTILGALNTLESDMATYGLTSKMKALYPFVGGTAAKHKYNFMDARDLDAAFRLVFSGGWTHSSTGALPNGTNAYANTYYNQTTVGDSLNSAHLSYYSRTNSNGTEVEIGVQEPANNYNLLEIRTSGTTYFLQNQSSLTSASDSDSRGFYLGNRQASNDIDGWRQGVKVINATTASNALPNGNIYLGAMNNAVFTQILYYTTKECAFASIGDGLTDTEAADFYTAVQAFQTTLGRQVGTPIPFAMPLDTYSGAAAAYSAARRLSSTYTGALIRVRRSSDNAEQDIGYNGSNVLDESALTSFVGAGNGFVTTWYDQSGNGRNVTRTTAIEQPRIVNSGTIETDGSNPAINFDSYKPLTYSTGVSYSAAAIVARVTTATTVNYAVGGTGVGLFYNGSAGAGVYGLGGYDGSNVGTLLTADLNRHLGWFNMTSSRLYVIRDNESLTDLTAFASSLSMGNSTDGIGGRDIGSDVLCFRGKMQEVILWSSQQASNATGIRSNINTFYSIY